MKNDFKHKRDDHQIFDGGRPEFRNINERIFAALESDDYTPLSDAEIKADLPSRQLHTAEQAGQSSTADESRTNLYQDQENPEIHPV